MKRSRIAFVLLAACAAAASMFHTVGVTLRAVYRLTKDALLFAPATSSEIQRHAQPRIVLHAAIAYVFRQAKRARPRVTPRWRMCPSA